MPTVCHLVRIGLAAALLGAASIPAGAAEAYPVRPMRMVVPLFVGAGTDIIARQMAGSLARVGVTRFSATATPLFLEAMYSCPPRITRRPWASYPK